MTERKQKSFSTVQDILETYFPAYADRERESSEEDYAQIGRDLASELGKKFEANLGK